MTMERNNSPLKNKVDSDILSYFEPTSNDEDYPVEISEERLIVVKKIEKIYSLVFEEESNTLAKRASKQERESEKLLDRSYAYGEITFKTFAYIMEFTREVFPDVLKPGALFLDAGSGIGKAVLAAGLLFPFKKCVGVEYIEQLNILGLQYLLRFDIKNEMIKDHSAFPGFVLENSPLKNLNKTNNNISALNKSDINMDNTKKLDINNPDENTNNKETDKENTETKEEKKEITETNENKENKEVIEKQNKDDIEKKESSQDIEKIQNNYTYLIPEFELIKDNVLNLNWNQYDMIFCSCTSFSDDLMNSISKKAWEMKPGALLITITKRIPEAKKIRWKLFDGFRRMMSWGSANIYFHQVREMKNKKTEGKNEKDNESSLF